MSGSAAKCLSIVPTGAVPSVPHLRDSHQRNADRGKEPAKPSFKEKSHVNFQRKTR